MTDAPIPPTPPPAEITAPPLPEPSAPPVASIETRSALEAPRTFKQRIETSLPWLVSSCLNLALLLILGLLILPAITQDKTVHEVSILPYQPQESDLSSSFEIATSNSTDNTVASADLREMTALPEGSLDVTSTEVAAPSAVTSAITSPVIAKPGNSARGVPSGRSLLQPLNISRPVEPLTKKELGQAENITDAVDGIGMQILEMLDHGDLMVIWMLDSSISLVDDRRLVAFRLNDVYRQIDAMRIAKAKEKGIKPPLLRSGVVAYGNDVMQVLRPTTDGTKAALKVADIPIDETGIENVFSATQWCVAKYSGSWKKQVLLVIWTDETGDDTYQLEATIALCKQYKVRVCVVGPTAVFGAETGTHAWIHAPTRQTFWLPVKKGPDTAFAERMLWPYWWANRLPEWHDPSVAVDFRGGWYGGYDMTCISSGMPPYALTRLARETGGGYTIFDRAMDRGPFTLEAMRPYTPDYRSAQEIHDEIHFVPFRHAIMASVEVTRNIPRDAHPDWTPWVLQSPGILKNRCRFYARESEKALVKAEIALSPFGVDGLEHLYEKEPSPRWKAWYDLTRGRLLAQSVRYAEMLATCKLALAGGIGDHDNCMQFGPMAHVISGPLMEARAKEAERLLRRCVDQNPNTPWAYLADRELLYPVGLGCRTWYVEPPPPVLIDTPPAMPSGGGGGGAIALPKL